MALCSGGIEGLELVQRTELRSRCAAQATSGDRTRPMMRSWINKGRLNLGLKRRILKHPVMDEIIGSFFAPKRLKLPTVELSDLTGRKAEQVSLLMLSMNDWDTP